MIDRDDTTRALQRYIWELEGRVGSFDLADDAPGTFVAKLREKCGVTSEMLGEDTSTSTGTRCRMCLGSGVGRDETGIGRCRYCAGTGEKP